MTLTIGLTGGIGCGKSTVAEMFAMHGAEVIDTDMIAHQLTAAGEPVLTDIAATLGNDVLSSDGTLNRKKLRQRVFSDAAAKKTLEDILHPLIREQVAKTLAQPSPAPYRIVVVPLLFETGAYQDIIQHSLVVDCSEQLQLRRALDRGTFSEEEVRAVMAVQCSRQHRVAAADEVILNEGNLDELASKVKRLHEKYLSLA